MPRQLLVQLANEPMSHAERAVVLLWWFSQQDPDRVISAAEIARAMEDAGYGRQHPTRLAKALKKDGRTVSRSKGFRLKAGSGTEIANTYGYLMGPRIPDPSNSMLPVEVLAGTRGYIERVVAQLNASYDVGLFDCTAVMARRLVETLIIEVFEHLGAPERIKGSDGHFLMLNGLIKAVEAEPKVNLGRNAKKGLADLKALGDLSAHNRRFNARQSDLDGVRSGLRVLVEELSHLAGFQT